MPFQAKITRARWVLGPFTSEDMLAIGSVVRDSIAERIGKGMNVEDSPAKPLKAGQERASRLSGLQGRARITVCSATGSGPGAQCGR